MNSAGYYSLLQGVVIHFVNKFRFAEKETRWKSEICFKQIFASSRIKTMNAILSPGKRVEICIGSKLLNYFSKILLITFIFLFIPTTIQTHHQKSDLFYCRPIWSSDLHSLSILIVVIFVVVVIVIKTIVGGGREALEGGDICVYI